MCSIIRTLRSFSAEDLGSSEFVLSAREGEIDGRIDEARECGPDGESELENEGLSA